MDPDAIWLRLVAWAQDERQDALPCITQDILDLDEWRSRGGFPPKGTEREEGRNDLSH